MAVISTFATLLSLGIYSVNAQDIVFGDPGPRPGEEGPTGQSCTTIGGPEAGQPCVFPFIYSGESRAGCITQGDPEGRAWCSTRVDTRGRHVSGGEHWAHCGPTCPGTAPGGPALSSAFTVRMSRVMWPKMQRYYCDLIVLGGTTAVQHQVWCRGDMQTPCNLHWCNDTVP